MYNKQNMQKMMIDKGITASNLSCLLGVSKTAIYNKIKGKTPFSVQDLSLMKDEYNLSFAILDDIFLNKMSIK